MAEKIRTLWNSKAIQEAYSLRHKFWLLDSFSYYMDNIDRFCEIDWIPNETDCIMARIRTTGIVQTKLEHKIQNEMKDSEDKPELTMTFNVVDVGGQRNERKKWIHCFSDVKAVIFVSNLAGYNRVLFEDSSKNRMHESIELFEKVTKNPIFKNTPIFLLLNKKDLFDRMVKEVELKSAFDDFPEDNNLESALDFVESKYRERMSVQSGRKVDVEPSGRAVLLDDTTTPVPDNSGSGLTVISLAAKNRKEVKIAFETVTEQLYSVNKEKLRNEVENLRAEQVRIFAQKQKNKKK